MRHRRLPPEKAQVVQEEVEDLKSILIAFWLETMQDRQAQYPERIKSSEMLAKYVLSEGQTSVHRKGPRRPSTTEVLRIAREMENGNGKD